MKKQPLLYAVILLLIPAFMLAQSSAGDIAFVGYNADGNDGFAFVTLVEISNNQDIYFTDDDWINNNSSYEFSGGEGVVKFTTNQQIDAGTVIKIEDINGTINVSPNYGTASETDAGYDLNASDEVLYAYTGSHSNPTFLTAFANDDFSVNSGGLQSTGLTDGTDAWKGSDYSMTDDDVLVYDGCISCYSSMNDFLPLLVDGNNWISEDGSGDQHNNSTAPDFPGDVTGDFSILSEYYGVFFNEIRADDDGTDDKEFIELVGHENMNITGFYIEHYNGDLSQDGIEFTHEIGEFTIPDDGYTDDEGNAIGYFLTAESGSGISDSDEDLAGSLQNGPDGLILYDGCGNILDAVAWEGTGDLDSDDPGTVSTSSSQDDFSFLAVSPDDDNTDKSLSVGNSVYNSGGSDWSLQSSTPGSLNSNQTSGNVDLPIELLSFNARVQASGVLLTWVTASETNNDYFELERSAKGKTFTTLSKIQAQGNSNQTQVYRYMDNAFEDQIIYYRLCQTDFDGTTRTLKTIEIQPEGAAPDLDADMISDNTVNIKGIRGNKLGISIYDLAGRLVYSKGIQPGSGSYHFKLPRILEKNRLFVFRVNDRYQQKTIKIIKQ